MLAHQLHRASKVLALARLRQAAADIRGGRHVRLGWLRCGNSSDAQRGLGRADGAAPLLAATGDRRQR
jgi:hypothetical protein